MRPSENIEKLIKNIDIDTNAKIDEEVLVELIEAFEKSKGKKTSAIEQNIWRIIMKSPITKLAAAAVIIIACLIGLSFWRTTGSGIALADVLTRIEQVTGYMYQLRSKITKQQISSNWMYTVFITQGNGIKMTCKASDPEPKNREFLLPEIYLLPHQNTLIGISHETKTYIRMKYDDALLESYKEQYNDPHIIIKQFLSCNHTSLGQSIIDGITVEGFQTIDLAYKGGFFGQADFDGEPENVNVKIWVDVNTFLPVRTEENITMKDGRHIHEVSYDFRWNVPVDQADFEPNIPDDYTSPVGDIIVPALNEETAIKGLRIYADLAGHYPDNLDKQIIMKESKKLALGDTTFWKDLPVNEKTRITNDISYPILRLVHFYETLIEDKKDPAYYGQTVGPNDTNKVLLRWKLDDGQYRVIFGDLSIKNVTAEELAEPEKP